MLQLIYPRLAIIMEVLQYKPLRHIQRLQHSKRRHIHLTWELVSLGTCTLHDPFRASSIQLPWFWLYRRHFQNLQMSHSGVFTRVGTSPSISSVASSYHVCVRSLCLSSPRRFSSLFYCPRTTGFLSHLFRPAFSASRACLLFRLTFTISPKNSIQLREV